MFDLETHIIQFAIASTEAIMECLENFNLRYFLRLRVWITPW